jgi:hypothetical protein
LAALRGTLGWQLAIIAGAGLALAWEQDQDLFAIVFAAQV